MLAKRLLCRNLFANILFDYGHKKKEAQMLEFPFCDPGEDANGANNMHNKKYCCILVFIVLSELKR